MSKPVIIVSPGRAGSTTLLRILNTVPGYNICGENGGMVNKLVDFYMTAKETKRNPSFMANYREANQRKPCWYNVYDLGQTRTKTIGLIRSLFNADQYRAWGFKGIRFPEGDREFFAILDHYYELFPNIKIILNYREDVKRQAKSKWMANRPNAEAYCLKRNEQYRRYNEKHPERCYLISLENIINKDATFYGLYDFLGERPDEVKIGQVLQKNFR